MGDDWEDGGLDGSWESVEISLGDGAMWDVSIAHTRSTQGWVGGNAGGVLPGEGSVRVVILLVPHVVRGCLRGGAKNIGCLLRSNTI